MKPQPAFKILETPNHVITESHQFEVRAKASAFPAALNEMSAFRSSEKLIYFPSATSRYRVSVPCFMFFFSPPFFFNPSPTCFCPSFALDRLTRANEREQQFRGDRKEEEKPPPKANRAMSREYEIPRLDKSEDALNTVPSSRGRRKKTRRVSILGSSANMTEIIDIFLSLTAQKLIIFQITALKLFRFDFIYFSRKYLNFHRNFVGS